MFNGMPGTIVEFDTHGKGDWRFCAFFMFPGDAETYIQQNTDEPTRYRSRPNIPQIALAA